jgi:hypothetical protein
LRFGREVREGEDGDANARRFRGDLRPRDQLPGRHRGHRDQCRHRHPDGGWSARPCGGRFDLAVPLVLVGGRDRQGAVGGNGRYVRAARNRDAERIRGSRAAVVVVEFPAQAAGFDANDGVDARVELVAAAEELDADHVFLERVTPAGKCLLDEVAQQAARPPSRGKLRRRKHPLERGANLVRR